MKLFLVDDNTIFRKNLKLYLEEHLNFEVVGEADDGENFMKKVNNDADIILMDINMPHMNGLDATKLSTWKKRGLLIIAVSQYKDSVDLQQLIGAGFKGFVSKTNLFHELKKAINTVHNGGYFFPEEIKLHF